MSEFVNYFLKFQDHYQRIYSKNLKKYIYDETKLYILVMEIINFFKIYNWSMHKLYSEFYPSAIPSTGQKVVLLLAAMLLVMLVVEMVLCGWCLYGMRVIFSRFNFLIMRGSDFHSQGNINFNCIICGEICCLFAFVD